MGSSYVEIGENGFWVHDALLSPFLRLLALHIDDPADRASSETVSATYRIRNQWLLASRYCFVGCVPVALDEAVHTEEGRKVVRKALTGLLYDLESAPSELSHHVFSLLGILDRPFPLDLETWRFVDIARAFLALMDGEIKAGTGDHKTFMPGSIPLPAKSE